MKKRIRMIIMALLICVCVFIPAVSLNAADESDSNSNDACVVVKYEDLEEVKDYLAGKNTYPTKEGYLFAGWYTTDDILGKSDAEVLKYAVRNSVPKEGSVYALFVPANVLDVKAQLSGELLDGFEGNDKGSIRFVTTVNSLLYQKVGFEVSYINSNGAKKSATSSSNKVYDKLYAVGSTTDEYMENGEEYLPTEFSAASKFFKACNLKNIPASDFGVPITVKPFWVTLDGSKVYGETVIKSMDDYFLAEDVYVSNSNDVANKADAEGYGTEGKPYATLNYALSKVKNQGTVHIVETYATTADFDWKEHNKTVNITGGELDFTTLPEKVLRAAQGTDTPDDTSDDVAAVTANVLDINDSVTFMDTSLKFTNGQQVYANGNTVKIASAGVTWSNSEAYIQIYGGSHSAPLKSDTNLILGAGQYTRVFGGGNYDSPLTGNVNVTLSGSINPNVDPSTHNRDYAVFGGGVNKSSVEGDINLNILDETVQFRHVYGGGEWNSVKGDIYMNFAGSAFTVYGGGYDTSVTGDVYLTMTGGWTEQIFGGCNGKSMTGNTNVSVLDGTVVRRIYGGCYNNTSGTSFASTACVNGHSNVSIGPDVEVLLNHSDLDNSIYAISRGDAAFTDDEGKLVEIGAFIFNENRYKDTYKSKLGYNDSIDLIGFSNTTHHYLITTNGNTADSSFGTVSSQSDYIRIKPRRGYSAVVKVEGTQEFYTESEAVFKLPGLTGPTDEKKITVTFDTINSSVDKSGYEARIDGAYYESFMEAIGVAPILDSKDTVTVTLLKDIELASQINIGSKIAIQNEPGEDITIYRGTELATTDMFNVTSTGTLTLAGVEDRNAFVFDGRTKAEANTNTSLDDAVGSTGSLIKADGNLFINNITIQYAKRTGDKNSGAYGGVINTAATNNKVNITDSTFANNFAGYRGGVIFATNERNSAITINGCVFENNRAIDAGGAICVASTNILNISDTAFIRNKAEGNFGGAVAMGSNLSIVNLSGKVTFDGNTTGTTSYGGGAIMTGSVLNIAENANVTIKNNETKGLGGGIYFNAGTAPKFILGEGAVLMMSDNLDKNGAVDIAIKDKSLQEGDKFVYGNNEEKTISEVAVGSVTYNVDVNGCLARIVELRHGETTTTYSSLQEAFEQAVDGDTITLLDNITLKNQLTISKSITLTTDGVADRTISCDAEVTDNHIIVVTATDKNVIFKGASKDSQLILDGTGVTLEKAFVHLEDATQIAMENVTMKNIVKTGSDANGGAIYNEAPLLVKNCTFTNCSAMDDNTKNNGGAICSSGSLTVESSVFMGNKAGNRGGAIYVSNVDETMIKDCIFGDGTDACKNSAINAGGAICVAGTTLTVNIENSTFNGNTAGYFGGAVAMTGSQATVNLSKEVVFDGNTAYSSETQFGSNTHGGGAISTGKALNISDEATVTITNNTVTNFGYGGGVYFQAGTAPVFSLGEGASLIMSGNTDAKYGDADIVVPSGKNATKFNFNGSYAISSIYTTADSLIALSDTANDTNQTITTITLIDGASGTSVAEGDQLVTGSTQADTIFTVVHGETEYALDNAGCLVAKGIALKHGDTTIRYETFTEAVQAAVDEDTIVIEKDITLDTSLDIEKTITITTDDVVDRIIYCGTEAASGVVISVAENKNVTFKGASERSQLIFDGNEQSMKNVFIAAEGEVTMMNVTMQNITTSGSYGAAVCIKRSATIENCSFINCSSTSTSANGGAIYVSAAGAGTHFADCRFDKCSSGYRGGAIQTKGAITVTSSQFANCHSDNRGGAICCEVTGVMIDSCTFGNKDDIANGGNTSGDAGGAIHVQGTYTLNIENSNFYGNKAAYFGGAVSFSSGSSTLNLSGKCIFRGNVSADSTCTTEAKYAELKNYQYRGGAIMAPANFNIEAGAWVEIHENECKYIGEKESGGDAICINTTNAKVSTFKVGEGASLYIYNNPSAEDVNKDICIQNGADISSFNGTYITKPPTTE